MRISDWSSDVCSSDLSDYEAIFHGSLPDGPGSARITPEDEIGIQVVWRADETNHVLKSEPAGSPETFDSSGSFNAFLNPDLRTDTIVIDGQNFGLGMFKENGTGESSGVLSVFSLVTASAQTEIAASERPETVQ